jgi:hypothetical protein
VRPNRTCADGSCDTSDDAVPFAMTEGALATIWVRSSELRITQH